jgi:hypothetical protein
MHTFGYFVRTMFYLRAQLLFILCTVSIKLKNANYKNLNAVLVTVTRLGQHSF